MLRTIRARLAFNFTLLIAGLMIFMLGLTAWLGYSMVRELRPRLQSTFEETQTLNAKNVLLNSAGYLSEHLLPSLFQVDISALNKEIDQVKEWLPIQSFIIADQQKRILTDGSPANRRYGQPLNLPQEPLPQQPILESGPEMNALIFTIGVDDRIAGYAVVTLSNAALQASLRMLDEQVTAQWESTGLAMLLGAAFTFLLMAFIAAILVWRLSRAVSEPISDMVAAAESCASGNLDISLRVRSDDELGHLAQALNTMAKELKVSQRRMRHLANYDSLTGLPNRHLFQDRLRHALHAADRSGHHVGLLFLDLDGFKAINDSLGHSLGDEVLKRVADRLRETVRASDTVARLGGDEFTVVAEGIHGPLDVEGLADKLLATLVTPYRIQDHRLHLSASIGITLYPQDGTSADALLHNADSAMYEAKRRGKNAYCLFTPDMDLNAPDRISLEQRLSQAIEAEEFELHYQPQIHCKSGRLIGVEALLRWRNPHELIQPGELIPLLEDTGLITQMTHWILSQGCRTLAEWRGGRLPGLRLAINLSSQQLAQADLAASIQGALAQTGLPPDALEIEITENSLLDGERSHAAATRLQQLGVRLTIDNFGTGYSSLASLHRLCVDALKIDRSLIQDIATNDDSALITSALIALARQLGIETAAQGVETRDQWAALDTQDCDLLQGFFISAPLPREQLEDWASTYAHRAAEWPAHLLTEPKQFVV
ncbi:EAL domain-containing protein [Thiocystis violacea]|uniref:EAL domain-containing protein n=1 Tax=Thiocystis violacea TaxID=13725 RepID=UPI001904A9AC|nr:EAL domain-containing protein [Thiocystis violacea]MBK1720785.1 hypothetical protein [Thiocystis violacea]